MQGKDISDDGWCIECKESAAFSRGVCKNCYTKAQRAGELDRYPTKGFTVDPEAHIRWAFGMHPDLVADIALEFGFRVTRV